MSRMINSEYTGNQFDLCPQMFLSHYDVKTECMVKLRQAVKATTSEGQGFFDVTVEMVKRQCQTMAE